MNKKRGELFLHHFKEDRQSISNSSLSDCFVDSDKDFSIEEFQNSLKNSENRLSDEDEVRIHDERMQQRCFLEISQRTISPWKDQTEANIGESGVELESDGNCSSESVIETLCESDKERLRELTEHDHSLDNLVLYYGLKSDVTFSSERTRKHFGDGGNIRQHHGDNAFGFEIYHNQVEIGDGEERILTDFYPHPPLSDTEVSSAERGGGGDEEEDETMSLFYELHNLPHLVEDNFKANDEMEETATENTSTKEKFPEAERTMDGGAFRQNEQLGRITSSRKRGSEEVLFDQDGLFDPHVLLCSGPRPISNDSRGGQHEFMRTNGARAGQSDTRSEAGYSILPNGSRRTQGKRPRYSTDMTSSKATDESKWNGNADFRVSSLDPMSYFYDAFRDKCSNFISDGEKRDDHGALLTWIPSESVCCSETLSNISLSEEKLEEDFKCSSMTDGEFSAPHRNRSTTRSIEESLWDDSNLVTSISTNQGFHFPSDAELCQLMISPSVVFPAALDSSYKRNGGCSSAVESVNCLSLESLITSFIDSEPQESFTSSGYQDRISISDPRSVNHTVADGRALQNFRDPDLGLWPEGHSEIQRRISQAPLAANVVDSLTRGDTIDKPRIAFSEPLEALPRFEAIPRTHPSLTFQEEQALPGDPVVRNWSYPYRQNPTQSSASPASLCLPAAAPQLTSQPSQTPHCSEVSLPRLLNELPFPLPPVPSGYKLVITHQSLPNNGGLKAMSTNETKIIIIHPANQETPRGVSDQHGTNTETNVRNIPTSQYEDLKYQQTSCNTPYEAGGLRRPRDFDLPCKPSLSILSNACVDGFRLNNEDAPTSSPATPVLDLSLSSVLSKIQNFPSGYTISAADMSPKPLDSSHWTNALLKQGISSSSTLKALDSRRSFQVNGIGDDARIRRPAANQLSCAGLTSLSAGQTPSQGPTQPSDCTIQRLLHQSSMDSPRRDVSTRAGLVDVIFPPNVVICSPQHCDQMAPSGQVKPSCSPQLPGAVESMDRFGSTGHSSPPRSVEPDSTVHAGNTEATRDIIRALSDKLRRNRTQRLHSDSLVSTTCSLDKPLSPSNKSAGSLSPDLERPSLRHSTNPKSAESLRTHSSQTVLGNQLNKKSTTSSNELSTFDIQIKTESSSGTTANRSQLQSSSKLPKHSLEGIEEDRNNETTKASDSAKAKSNRVLTKTDSYQGDHPATDALIKSDTLDFDLNQDFFFFLDAPISTVQRQDEEKITYLNKGQYYRLSLECHSDFYKTEGSILRSVVMVLNRDSRAVGDELEAWKIWHTRQQSYKQRILDIDYKDACGVSLNSMTELAYNATALTWSPADQPVKVNVAVNCLSTDFSNQKGVKGIPLHIQIDTYDLTSPETPICRAYCKIKVFCDKGAERKVRDDERKRERRFKVKTEKEEAPVNGCSSLRQSNFYPVEDQAKDPILFNPNSDTVQTKTNEKKTLPSLPSHGYSRNSMECDECNAPRRPRATSIIVSREYQRVLLYVREVQEEVFTALLLKTPTLSALAQAIHEKCNIETHKIKNIYKKSKKGILVKMDDKILRHYSNESTFIITSVTNSENPDLITYDVILAEIDVD